MIVRIITALIGIPLVLTVMYYGNLALLGFVLMLVTIGMKEYINIISKLNVAISKTILYFSSLMFPIAAHFAQLHIGDIFILVFLLISIYLLVFKQLSIKDTALHFFGIVYLGGTLTYILKLRLLPGGFNYLLITFLFIWMSDSAAYFVGRFLGRNKLAPTISPKKTIEGSIGGLFFAIILSIVLAKFLVMPLYLLLGLAVVVNFFAQTGDLVESAIKRQAKVKDSGHLLPGHGGVLDRFDSTFFAFPVVYLYLFYFIGR